MALDLREKTTGNASGTDLSDEGKIVLDANRAWSITATDTDVGRSGLSVLDELQGTGQLPLEGDPHPDGSSFECRKVAVQRVSPVFYEARADYKTRPRQNDGSQGNDVPPWDIPTTVSYRSVTSDIPVEFDFNGELIANPGTLEPVFGVTRRFSDLQVTLKRAFLNFTPSAFNAFKDTVNSDTFLSFEPGTGLIYSIAADEQHYDGSSYFDVTAEILFRTAYATTADKAWYHRRAITGYYERVILGDPFNVEITARSRDAEGIEVTQPIRLDESGYRLADDDPNTVFEETQLYGTSAFGSMGF